MIFLQCKSVHVSSLSNLLWFLLILKIKYELFLMACKVLHDTTSCPLSTSVYTSRYLNRCSAFWPLSVSVNGQNFPLQYLYACWISAQNNALPLRFSFISSTWLDPSPHPGFSSGTKLWEWPFLAISSKAAAYIPLSFYHFPLFGSYSWLLSRILFSLFIDSLLHYSAGFTQSLFSIVF